MTTLPAQQQRQRKFLLVLPLLVLPFLTLAFWSLGGGKGTTAHSSSAVLSQGLNLQLPEPRLDEQAGISKLTLYQEARRQTEKQDPATARSFLHRLGFSDTEEGNPPILQEDAPPSSPEQHEAAVHQRLEQLTALMQPSPAAPSPPPSGPVRTPPQDRFNQDVNRLETLMHTLGTGQAANPEMQQIEGMLERILDIQHPYRVRSRLAGQPPPERHRTLPLQGVPQQAAVTLLTAYPEASAVSAHSPATAGFYGLEDPARETVPESSGNTIAAAIHETQTVVAGGVVRLRLLQDAVLAGTLLPKGSLVYATCRISGERLSLEVKSVRAQQAVLPVALTAFDLDGQEGIYVPGSLTREAARQGAGSMVQQSLQLNPLTPSLGAQAAGAGISAAQGLLSRTTRQMKITLKAGYQLLLRDQQHHP